MQSLIKANVYNAIIFLLLTTTFHNYIFALPCPNGRGVLYKGDTIDQVIKACGQPDSQRTYERSLFSSERWDYNLPANYYSAPAQLSIQMDYNRVANIHLYSWDPFSPYVCQTTTTGFANFAVMERICYHDSYLLSTPICGSWIKVGDTEETVLAACGLPTNKQNLQKNIVRVTEFIYGTDSPGTLIFQDGKLVEF